MRRWLAILVLVGAPLAAWLIDRQVETDGDRDAAPGADGPPSSNAEATEQPPISDGEAATPRTIHDGDSFVARFGDADESEVRLIGINAPELGECQYRESRDALRQLVGTDPVVLERDVTDRDQYGRLLRYVHAHGVLANLDQVERGLALVLDSGPDIAHHGALRAAQQRAREARAGMWNPDACGAAASTTVHITEVEEDPPGRDRGDLNGEYAVVGNGGEAPVDMTGWKLRDDSTRNRFWFPPGFVLHPGRSVTVHVGRGEDTDDALHWHRRFPIWDNSGDTALLLDPNGNVVSYLDVVPP